MADQSELAARVMAWVGRACYCAMKGHGEIAVDFGGPVLHRAKEIKGAVQVVRI